MNTQLYLLFQTRSKDRPQELIETADEGNGVEAFRVLEDAFNNHTNAHPTRLRGRLYALGGKQARTPKELRGLFLQIDQKRKDLKEEGETVPDMLLVEMGVAMLDPETKKCGQRSRGLGLRG